MGFVPSSGAGGSFSYYYPLFHNIFNILYFVCMPLFRQNFENFSVSFLVKRIQNINEANTTCFILAAFESYFSGDKCIPPGVGRSDNSLRERALVKIRGPAWKS